MRLPIFDRLKACFSAFNADRSGIAVVYVAVALPVIIGFSLLAIDFGRLATLQSSLQHGADALALAGAGELDRNTDAITRSERAITNLITTNTGLFSTTAVTINRADVSTCYLGFLPTAAQGGDATAIGSANASFPCLTNTPTNAGKGHYVQVTVNATTFTTVFPATFLGATSNTSTSSAVAVAGQDVSACAYTPIFICNPFEPTGNTNNTSDFGFATYFSTQANKRRMMAFVNNGSTYSAGNWGFLSSPLASGANALADSIGLNNPPQCYAQPGVSTKPGKSTGPVDNSFGSRFDLSATNTYPPGTNVRKGYDSSKCNKQAEGTPITKFLGLPRDSCLPSSCSPVSAPTGSGGQATTAIGNGDWGNNSPLGNSVVVGAAATVPSFGQYWYVNFGWSGILAPFDSTGSTRYSNSNLPSRYDIYTYEKTHNAAGAVDNTTTTNLVSKASVGGEVGNPICNGTAKGTDAPDRRLLDVAVLNCSADGLANGNSGGPYVPVEYASIFLTEPEANNYVYGEVSNVITPGGANGQIHDLVQLYR